MARAIKPKESTRVTVTFDEDVYRQLTAIAEKHGVSRSWVVRRAVSNFLEQHQGEQLQLALKLPGVRR